MRFDLSKKTPEQRHNEHIAGCVAFCFFATCLLHLVSASFFGVIYWLSNNEGFWQSFVHYFGLIQMVYMLPLIVHCRLRGAYAAMAGFILGAALTMELGLPLAGFGLVCAAP